MFDWDRSSDSNKDNCMLKSVACKWTDNTLAWRCELQMFQYCAVWLPTWDVFAISCLHHCGRATNNAIDKMPTNMPRQRAVHQSRCGTFFSLIQSMVYWTAALDRSKPWPASESKLDRHQHAIRNTSVSTMADKPDNCLKLKYFKPNCNCIHQIGIHVKSIFDWIL